MRFRAASTIHGAAQAVQRSALRKQSLLCSGDGDLFEAHFVACLELGENAKVCGDDVGDFCISAGGLAVGQHDQREDDRSLIWEFLDLSSSKEKMDFLQKKKSEITEEFIGIAAQSLDFVENDGTVEERYEAVMQYLRTVMRYESGRLR